MHLPRARVVSLLAASSAFGMLCAPAAIADPGNTVCEPGQIVIDGQCNTPPPPNATQAPSGGSSGSSTGGQNGGHHY